MIFGLYVVLWGKAKELADTKQEKDIPYHDHTKTITVFVDQSSEKSTSCKSDLKESLLPDKSTYAN